MSKSPLKGSLPSVLSNRNHTRSRTTIFWAENAHRLYLDIKFQRCNLTEPYRLHVWQYGEKCEATYIHLLTRKRSTVWGLCWLDHCYCIQGEELQSNPFLGVVKFGSCYITCEPKESIFIQCRLYPLGPYSCINCALGIVSSDWDVSGRVYDTPPWTGTGPRKMPVRPNGWEPCCHHLYITYHSCHSLLVTSIPTSILFSANKTQVLPLNRLREFICIICL
jgi:hypothetical protein